MTNINESEICKASDWGPWGDCTEECGGGLQYSTRYPLTEGYNEFECGELSRSRECNTTPCPSSTDVQFKYIDYKNLDFIGWTDDELESGCGGTQNILRVSDTLTLNYSADSELEVGTELLLPPTNKWHEYFSVSANGEWVYSNGMFLKLKNRQIVDTRECEILSDPSVDSTPDWCGAEFTSESYVCVRGTSEVGGSFSNSVADRYYYSQENDSLKTEWTSRNNLLSIIYLDSSDPRNPQTGSNIWAIFDKQSEATLYYTVDFDETKPCPPLRGAWIPVIPQTSHTVNLSNNCEESDEGQFSCDLKDASTSNWFNFVDESMFINSLEKNGNIITDGSVESFSNFDGILSRGAGFPSDEENVFAQTNRGHFNLSQLTTHPPSVGYSKYFTTDEVGGEIQHKIEVPLNQVIDLVNLKIMSVMSEPGQFDIQVYSISEQKWVHLQTINHFVKTQQIVTDIKNDFYDANNPPLDGTDTLVESVVAVRVYVGSYDYDNNTSSPISLSNKLQGLLLHSMRIEGRVQNKCNPSEIAHISSRGIKQIVPNITLEPPKLYPNSTEIVGTGCVGNLLYGNYRYTGRVDSIGYNWYVNGVSVANTRHFYTDGYAVGDELKFSVTFSHSEGKTDTFESSLVLSNCKTELFPPNNNSADFLYTSSTDEGDFKFITGFSSAEDACSTNETNKITFHWRNNLGEGEKLSTEQEFETKEKVNSGYQYFVNKNENYVIKLNSDMQVAKILSCPPHDFNIQLNNNFAIDSESIAGTELGKFVGSPNKGIKYFLNTTSFGIHGDLFRLDGLDTINNIQNMNLVLDGDISEIGDRAKITVSAKSADDVGEISKNFTINIRKDELNRFAECVRFKLGGFETDILNGNYGLIFEETSQNTGVSGYQTHDQRLVFRTNRKFTDGFLLLDGTVDFGAGYIYSEIKYNSGKTRWELYVHVDDNAQDTNYNEEIRGGKLCAFSAETQLRCPVNIGFTGISASYGSGIILGNTEVAFGDDYLSDCSDMGIC